MDENEFGVPAGWYPDPLGLPQLRWWDNRAWTEHTSEARAPIVIQPGTPKVAYADDELPSRREQREREKQREAASGDVVTETELEVDETGDAELVSAQPLLAATLRELEPPAPETVDEATPGPVSAAAHANVAPAAVRVVVDDEEPAKPQRSAKPTKVARGTGPKTYTIAVWVIAIMPILQLAASLVLILVAGLGHNLPIMLLVWLAPFLIVWGLAAYDKLELSTKGHRNPASSFWAILTAPAYLAVRATRTYRETGKGFGPIITWLVGGVIVLGSIIAVPGILISVIPGVFANEVENSVAQAATVIGGDIIVSCPNSPPLVVDEMFTCVYNSSTGTSDSIVVSLQRANGWITWQVEDWGVAMMGAN